MPKVVKPLTELEVKNLKPRVTPDGTLKMDKVVVDGRPKKSLSEQQVQEVKKLAGALPKQRLAAYLGMCENTLNEICKAVNTRPVSAEPNKMSVTN